MQEERQIKVSHTVYPESATTNISEWFNYLKKKTMEKYTSELSYMERKIVNELHDERLNKLENIKKERERMLTKLKILDILEALNFKINVSKDYIRTHGTLFPELAEKAKHDIEISEMARKRLIQRYFRA